jgi:hypothetical protein
VRDVRAMTPCKKIWSWLAMILAVKAAEAITQPSKIVMDANWKWEASGAPRWVAPFMGTNDKIGLPLQDVTDKLSTFTMEEVEFVTVVGGMKYLWMLALRDFAAVTFFDMNINELTKLRLCNEHILAHDYDEWTAKQGMRAVQKKLVNDTRRHFLPASLYLDGVSFVETDDFEWPQPGRHLFNDSIPGRQGSMWTLFDPEKFPEYSWHPTRKEYEQVRRNLERVNEQFFLGLPVASAAPHRLAVVWVDGVSIPYGRVLCVSPTAMSIGIYAELSKGHVWTDKDPNSMWYDAHFWWETRVRMSTRGRHTDFLHLWAPEDKQWQMTAYDWPFYHSGVIEFNDARSAASLKTVDGVTTVVTHLIVGKGNSGKDCSTRRSDFVNFVRKVIAGNPGLQRIVLTEPNADSADVSAPCAMPMRVFLDHIVPQVTDGTSFVSRLVYTMAGETTTDKNVLIILDNERHDHMFTQDSVGPAGAFSKELVNRSQWVLTALTLSFEDEAVQPKALFWPRGAAQDMFRPFAGIQCALFMMFSPRQHIEMIGYMADLRNQLQTVQNLWPVSDHVGKP